MTPSSVDPPEWGFDAASSIAPASVPRGASEPEPESRKRAVVIISLLGLVLVGIVGLVSLLDTISRPNPEPGSEELAAPVPGETGTERPTTDAAPDSVDERDRVSPDSNRRPGPLPRASDGGTGNSTATTEPGSSDSLGSTGAPSPSESMAPATPTSAPEPPSPGTAEPPPEGVTQVAYAVDSAMMIFAQPDQRVEWALPNPTQFGGPRVVTVLGTSPDKRWHKVSVPVQPNGSVGWVQADTVRIEEHNYRARITLGSRRVQVWDGDRLVTDTGAVIGKSSTPTPLGTFFVRDIIPQSYSDGAYGPWIIALSGFSEVMDSFDGGLPAIAVHGTNRPDLVGRAASNGCIRIPNDIVTDLASQVPLGTQVEVIA